MTRILVKEFSKEAASRTRGLILKDKLLSAFDKDEPVIVDFSEITRFASPFFNNSFAALAFIYGFNKVEAVRIENISETGMQTYESSMENAKDIFDNEEMSQKIKTIIDNSPKKVGV